VGSMTSTTQGSGLRPSSIPPRRRLRVAAAISAGTLATLVTLSAGLVAAEAALGKNGFRTYPTCHVLDFRGQHPPPVSHRCHIDDDWGTVFIASHERNVHYKICIRRPDQTHDCYRRRTFGHSETDGFYSGNTKTGTYRFTWRVHGEGVIDRDRLKLLASSTAIPAS